ncbi:MAG: hypothetical protein GY891_05390 [Bacteroidetes bacterium]|nr:hypothetical protein [Bacteroidota bacterium]
MDEISRKEARNNGLRHYFTGKPCKHGHIDKRYTNNSKCCKCVSLLSSSYYNENIERMRPEKLKYQRENYSKLKESKSSYSKKRYKENKEKIAEKNKQRRESNPERYKEYWKDYRKKNSLSIFTRHSLQRIEKANCKKRIAKSELELGYSQLEFKEHIENLFTEGMSWGNRSAWHIDHVKPIKAFIVEGVTNLKIINALSNLQPLWAVDNLRKGSKY